MFLVGRERVHWEQMVKGKLFCLCSGGSKGSFILAEQAPVTFFLYKLISSIFSVATKVTAKARSLIPYKVINMKY